MTTTQWSSKEKGEFFSAEVTKTTVDNEPPVIKVTIRDLKPVTRTESPFKNAKGTVSAYDLAEVRELANLVAWASKEAEK